MSSMSTFSADFDFDFDASGAFVCSFASASFVFLFLAPMTAFGGSSDFADDTAAAANACSFLFPRSRCRSARTLCCSCADRDAGGDAEEYICDWVVGVCVNRDRDLIVGVNDCGAAELCCVEYEAGVAEVGAGAGGSDEAAAVPFGGDVAGGGGSGNKS